VAALAVQRLAVAAQRLAVRRIGGRRRRRAPACPKPVGQICHEFIANDNSRNQITT